MCKRGSTQIRYITFFALLSSLQELFWHFAVCCFLYSWTGFHCISKTMDSQYRPAQLPKALPAQPISTGPSHHTQSQSPFRYLNQRLDDLSEKDQTPLTDVSSRYTPAHRISRSTSRASTPAPHSRQSPQIRSRTPTPLIMPVRNVPTYSNRLKPWIPLILYAISSLVFVVAIAFWKSEVFQGAIIVIRSCRALNLA